MPKHVNPFIDTAFKIIFGREKDKDILIRFLNDLLEDLPFYDPITDVTYRNNEKRGDTVEDRGVVTDVHCTTQHGRNIIIEMQNRQHANFEQRLAFYNSRAIDEQAPKGKWDFSIAPVYSICFTDFMVYPDICKLRIDSCQCDTQSGKPLNDIQRYIYIQLPMMQAKTPEECSGKLEQWIYTLKNMENMTERPFAARDEAFRRLSEVGSIAALSPEEKRRYDEDQKRYWVITTIEQTRYNEGRAEGRAEGRVEGRANTLREMALSLIALGVDDDIIQKSTKLSLEEIAVLRTMK